MEISVPTTTILKVFAALIIAYALYMLWPLVLLVFLALFLAVTLHSFVDWLCAKGMKRWVSLWIVIGGLSVVLGVAAALLVPAMINQVTCFSQNLPRIRDDALGRLPVDGWVRLNIVHLLNNASWSETQAWLDRIMSAGGIALGGAFNFPLIC